MPTSKNIPIHNTTYRLGAHLLASWEKPYFDQQAIARILQALIAENEQRTLLAALAHAREEDFALQQLHAIMERFIYDLTLTIQTEEHTIDDIGSKWCPFIQALQQILVTDNTIITMDAILSGDTPATTQAEEFIAFLHTACMAHIQQDGESTIDAAHIKQQLAALLSSQETEDEESTDDTKTITLEDFQQDHAPTLKAKHLLAEIEYLLDPKGTAPSNLFSIDREALSGNYLPYLNNARTRLETALAQLADLLTETDKPINMHAVNLIEAEIHTITFVIAYRKQHNQLDSEERRRAKPLTEKQKLLKANILQQLLNKAQDSSIDKLRRMQQQHRETVKACHAKHLQDQQHIAEQAALLNEKDLLLQQRQTQLKLATSDYASLEEQFAQQKEMHADATVEQQQRFEEMQARYASINAEQSEDLSKTKDTLAAAIAHLKSKKKQLLQKEELLLDTQKKHQTLEAKLTRRNDAFNKLNAKFKVMQEDIVEMSAHLMKVNEQNEAQVGGLQKRLEALKATLKETEHLLAESEEGKEAQQTQLLQLKKTIAAQASKLEHLTQAQSDMQSELAQREKEALALVEQFRTKNKELEQLKHQQLDTIGEHQNRAAGLEAKLAEKNNNITRLLTQIKQQESWLKRGMQVLQQHEATIADLKAQLESKREQIAAFSSLFQSAYKQQMGQLDGALQASNRRRAAYAEELSRHAVEDVPERPLQHEAQTSTPAPAAALTTSKQKDLRHAPKKKKQQAPWKKAARDAARLQQRSRGAQAVPQVGTSENIAPPTTAASSEDGAVSCHRARLHQPETQSRRQFGGPVTAPSVNVTAGRRTAVVQPV